MSMRVDRPIIQFAGQQENHGSLGTQSGLSTSFALSGLEQAVERLRLLSDQLLNGLACPKRIAQLELIWRLVDQQLLSPRFLLGAQRSARTDWTTLRVRRQNCLHTSSYCQVECVQYFVSAKYLPFSQADVFIQSARIANGQL